MTDGLIDPDIDDFAHKKRGEAPTGEQPFWTVYGTSG